MAGWGRTQLTVVGRGEGHGRGFGIRTTDGGCPGREGGVEEGFAQLTVAGWEGTRVRTTDGGCRESDRGVAGATGDGSEGASASPWRHADAAGPVVEDARDQGRRCGRGGGFAYSLAPRFCSS